MENIHVHVSIYGEISRCLGGIHLASTTLEFLPGAVFSNLLNRLGIAPDQKGYVFINSILCDAPGLNASENEPLNDRDHVGIFSLTHMWPYQYRDGAHMSESLRNVMKTRGAMHHSYQNLQTQDPHS